METPQKQLELPEMKKDGFTPSALKGNELQEFHELIEKKVSEYDPNKAAVEDDAEFDTTETMGFFEIIMRQANACDKFLLTFSIFFSILFGAAMPGFCLFFGEMVDGVGGV